MSQFELEIAQQEINEILSELALRPYSHFIALTTSHSTSAISTRGKYMVRIWAERCDQNIAVLVEAELNKFFWKCVPRVGFYIDHLGRIKKMSESKTWDFD